MGLPGGIGPRSDLRVSLYLLATDYPRCDWLMDQAASFRLTLDLRSDGTEPLNLGRVRSELRSFEIVRL